MSGRAADETIKQASLLQHRTGDESYHRNSGDKKQTDRRCEQLVLGERIRPFPIA
jgi:hypothetical protein